MRMRKKKNGEKRMLACADIHITEPFAYKGRWRELTGERRLYAEIGCGKGGFITELARRNPDSFYIGVEKVKDVIVVAMEKIKNAGLSNVLFVCGDAETLTDIFDEGELNGLYLNFSDPWPKKKHAKRRLTYVRFLERYKHVLTDGGQIYFKTDNRPLFDFSLEQFALARIALSDVTNDLHNSAYEAENIHTEYEDNFSAKGFTINRLVGTVDKSLPPLSEQELEAYERTQKEKSRDGDSEADGDEDENEAVAEPEKESDEV